MKAASPRPFPYSVALSIAVLFLLYLPFCNQAFHMDDTVYIAVAKQIVNDWKNPFGFSYNWYGTQQPVGNFIDNLPGHSYYMAIWIKWFGLSEFVLHLSCFPFLALTFYGMVHLCKRFQVPPLLGGWLLAGSPAILVLSHTCMPDIAALSFFTASIALFIRGVDHPRLRTFFFSAFFLIASCLVKYTGLLLPPLFAGYLATHRSQRANLFAFLRSKRTILLGLFSAGALLSMPLLSALIHRLIAARTHIKTTTPFSHGLIIETLIILTLYLSSTTLFPVAYAPLWFNTKNLSKKIRLAMATLLSAMVFFFVLKKYPDRSNGLLISTFFFLGITILFELIGKTFYSPKTEDSPDRYFLSFWVFFIFLSCPLLYFTTVRRIIYLVPPLLILFLKEMKPLFAAGISRKILKALLLGTTLTLAIAVSFSDFERANTYRWFSEQIKSYPSRSGTRWFAGHWGFQYYMEQIGWKAFDVSKDKLSAGDILVISTTSDPYFFINSMPQLLTSPPSKPVWISKDILVIPGPTPMLPIRTISYNARSNFYAYLLHPASVQLLPYGFSDDPSEVFLVIFAPKTSS